MIRQVVRHHRVRVEWHLPPRAAAAESLSRPADLTAAGELLLPASTTAVCAGWLSIGAGEVGGGSDLSAATDLSMLTRSAADLHEVTAASGL